MAPCPTQELARPAEGRETGTATQSQTANATVDGRAAKDLRLRDFALRRKTDRGVTQEPPGRLVVSQNIRPMWQMDSRRMVKRSQCTSTTARTCTSRHLDSTGHFWARTIENRRNRLDHKHEWHRPDLGLVKTTVTTGKHLTSFSSSRYNSRYKYNGTGGRPQAVGGRQAGDGP